MPTKICCWDSNTERRLLSSLHSKILTLAINIINCLLCLLCLRILSCRLLFILYQQFCITNKQVLHHYRRCVFILFVLTNLCIINFKILSLSLQHLVQCLLLSCFLLRVLFSVAGFPAPTIGGLLG